MKRAKPAKPTHLTVWREDRIPWPCIAFHYSAEDADAHAHEMRANGHPETEIKEIQ